MKKQLLIGLSIGVCISAAAQTSRVEKMNTTLSQTKKIEKISSTFYHAASSQKRLTATRGSRSIATRDFFTSSRNAFGVIVSAANCLTANQATNTIHFSHRISQDWTIAGSNNGYIQSTFSSDNGNHWDSLLQAQDNANFCRYPSGTIFNPGGNTDPSQAFGVVSGPITNSETGTTGNWTGNYFASTQLNNTNNQVDIRLNATDGVARQSFARIEMAQAGDSMAFVTGGLYSGDPAGASAAVQGYHGIALNKGKFNGTNFTWAVDSILPNYRLDPSDNSAQTFSEAVSAWSQDGSIGYVVAVGIEGAATDLDKLAFQPMVWKTIDGGDTWNHMTPGNFSGIPAINAKLRTAFGVAGTKKAFYSFNSGLDAVVDYQGNLHIVSVVLSGSTDDGDSLGFAFSVTASPFVNYIFDTYTTSATGDWNAMLIDSLQSITADDNSPFDDGDGQSIQIDARIQASRSTDGKHIFYIWTDTPEESSVAGENTFPDLKAKAVDLEGNKITPTIKFADDGANFFMFASSIALESGGSYSIPVTNSDIRGGSTSGLDPINHYYRKGVKFDESDYVGINEITSRGNLAISQNYPNPFSNTTSIQITLTDAATVSLEVYDAIGQQVSAQVAQKLSVGTHTFTIDGTKLKPGIYFYTVKAGANSATRKLIVQ